MKTKPSSPSPKQSALKQRVVLLLKFTFVVGLLYFLAKKGFISVQATQQALKQWNSIIPAIAALFLTALLGVVRWRWLLIAQGIQMSWRKTLQLTLIGNFFNIALPGAVSGDFVKAFYVGKEINGHRVKAFGSILFDRVAGLSALVLVSAGALALGYHNYSHSMLLNGIQALITFAAATVIVFYTYLFFVREKHDPLLRVFKILEKKVSKAAALTRIYESLRHYHHHRSAVIKVLAISIVIHLLVGWSYLSFAQALGETSLPLLSLYVVVPLGLLITAIPIAPAGVGTGNIAFLYLFHLIGSERGGDIFSLGALTNILIGCVGGLVYFRFKSEQPSGLTIPSHGEASLS